MALVTLIVVAGGSASIAAGQAGGSDALSADEVRITVEVQPNGTAIWTVEYHYRLGTENRSAAFDRLQDRLVADRSNYVGSVRSDVERTVGAVENATGRSMAVESVSVDARRQSVPREAGLVVHRFEWSGFAVVDDSTVHAGEPLRGFYIGPRTQLTVEAPAGYEIERVDPAPDDREDGALVWTGGRFDASEPQIVFTASEGGPPPLPSVAGLVAVSVGVGSITVVRRRRNREAGAEDSESSAATTTEDPADQPPTPLSNEEHVQWVLERHDGRVKQQVLAEECGWGDSKTSKVVRRLAEAGTIEVFRLGRENVITAQEHTDD
ncbi:DUF7345 domain-containing protein [Halococcoides cellulosivorans]|uniref:DUF4897 domain-containing protein n=1 Tax=Halococcoides cellulosivorans TaxID=1679096 RepID=A0A2R4X2S2_9EURY|nr:hypothetical protein [Halococcoides cellulosivorans]AWB28074.1 hypothetical protein HARCEL1_10330 [Halococcoides cellulosivorans]